MATTIEGAPTSNERQERIWDPITRLLKWALAGAVAVVWWLGENMGFDTARLHVYIGYAVGGLLTARLIWGLVGPKPARFSSLFSAISQTPRYLGSVFSRRPSLWPGHNPLGSLWIIAIFLTLAVQVGTGLMAYSDSFYEGGPLYGVVAQGWTHWANAVHEITGKILLALVILHVSAAAFYGIWKGENLVRPMITGWKRVSRDR